MGKLLENHSFQSSFNLIGMNVDIETGNVDSDTGNALIESGMVESVSKRGTENYIRVNGEEYSTSAISRVNKN